MSYQFRPALTSEAKPLIGLYSQSGCGKTWSALLIARGYAGPSGKVGMIETEGGRGEAYADLLPGGYLVLPIRESYSPREYGEAIDAAEKAKLDVLVIDSASHEWEGIGGVLHMAAKNQEEGKKGPLVWQTPKIDHARHFMGRLIATPIPLVIVCMRAKYPMEERPKMIRAQGGGLVPSGEKEWIKSTELEPKQSEDILYEMFVHGWIDQEHKFHGTKYSRADWREIFLDGEPITMDTGKRIAAWSKRPPAPATTPTVDPAHAAALQAVTDELVKQGLGGNTDDAKKRRGDALQAAFGVARSALLEALPVEQLRAGLVKLQTPPPATTSGNAVVPSGSAPVTVASTPAEQPGLALSTPATSTTATEPTEERAPWEADDPSPIDGGTRDEATVTGLIASIVAEVKKWAKVPPQNALDAIWAGYLGGTKDLTKADPAVLTDILADVRLYTKKDAAAMAKINGYARAARVAS